MIGKVAQPGGYEITSHTDVMQALALAESLNLFAMENDIHILRSDADGSRIAIFLQSAEGKEGIELKSNVILRSSNVVVMP